jgi:membrane-bound lytic murein transglycosylase B
MMIWMFYLRLSAILLFFILAGCATKPVADKPALDTFVRLMAEKHGYDRNQLGGLLERVDVNEDILRKMSKPSESLPWYKYRQLFLTQARMADGVAFWRDHLRTLASVEQTYGVPASMIVAILGIETNYGKRTGVYPVLDALFTLAFAYPPRSQFFQSELENFLLLCRGQQIEPRKPLGSYAGAMGMPQFMPSSYLNYAIDFNSDGNKDIWQNPDDAIASIANYFAAHGWQKDGQIAMQLCDSAHKSSEINCSFKIHLRNPGLQSNYPKISNPLLLTEKAKEIALEQEDGKEIWATFQNFLVITRYNKSPLYAMAAFQLSLALSNQFKSTTYEQTHYGLHRPAGQRLLE